MNNVHGGPGPSFTYDEMRRVIMLSFLVLLFLSRLLLFSCKVFAWLALCYFSFLFKISRYCSKCEHGIL